VRNLLGTLVVLTWRQSGMYASNETLWLMTVAKNPVRGWRTIILAWLY